MKYQGMKYQGMKYQGMKYQGMKYQGSKRRIAKYIVPLMESVRGGRVWVEPFVGGANSFDKVANPRIGGDSNRYVVALLREMQVPGFVPPLVDEKLYYRIKDNPDGFDNWLVGFAGVCLSFGAKWFGGFARDGAGVRDFQEEALRNISRQGPLLCGAEFQACSYDELVFPDGSLVYCDPPYEGTAGYSDPFDHARFWEWCRMLVRERGCLVFVSELSAPDDFELVWSQELVHDLGVKSCSRRVVECLFRFGG